ncbi:MAG: hypothetical protein M0Z77_02245 [Thermoplasmatales archaeon]|nr:hypothetical protein [Thermoplasmatales archaeon]
MKYCLLNIAYDDSFYGFQVQPNLKTVQGEILKALSSVGIMKVYGSSRTDSHVRSASSIIEVEHDDIQKICKIVDSVKGVAVKGFYESDSYINLRRSLRKEYLYYCDRKLDRKLLKQTIDEFMRGKMDYFSRDPTKKIALDGIRFSMGKFHTVFLFEGTSFSWNFVRISAETIIMRAEGKIQDDEWTEMLSGKKRTRYRGKPTNLILYRTKAPFKFTAYQSRNLNRLRARMFQDLYWLAGISEELREIVNELDFLDEK